MVIPQSQEDLHRPPGNSPVPRKSSMVAGSLATACVARKEQCSPRGPTDPLRSSPTNGERWEPTCLLMLISCCDSRGGLQKEHDSTLVIFWTRNSGICPNERSENVGTAKYKNEGNYGLYILSPLLEKT